MRTLAETMGFMCEQFNIFTPYKVHDKTACSSH